MPEKVKEAAKKPNILVIWGDDIGISNLSCYSHGLMGYQTPNIDRLAKEGVMFIDADKYVALARHIDSLG